MRGLAIALAFLLPCALRAAITVTDENGVIYDIIDGTMNVNVSVNNASAFSDKSVDILIPAQVIDKATTAVTDEPYTVVGIVNNAFRGTSITSVTIEAPLDKIPQATFQNCPNLATVVFPETITNLESTAFDGCTSLRTVSNTAGLTTIQGYAFRNCASLQEFYFPEGLTSLSSYAFQGCTSLTEITLPSTLQNVMEHCFENCTSLETVNFSEGQTSIREYAFNGCKSLKAPKFPDSLASIASNAFANCPSLGDVVLPNHASLSSAVFTNSSITSITWPESAIALSSSVFEKVHVLEEVTIPGWLTVIPQSLFQECDALKKVTLSQGVKTINYRAFYKDAALETLVLPQSLGTINSEAFCQCSSLRDFDFPEIMSSLAYRAFAGCSSLEHLKLPAGADAGEGVFGGCELITITFPDREMGTLHNNGIFGGGDGHKRVTEIYIPGWMKNIPGKLFNKFAALKDVTLAEGVESIGTGAFSDCGIETITFPSTLRSIGTEAFNGCRKLAEVNFNDGLMSIGQKAFFTCESLTELKFPSSLSYMGEGPFWNCKNLTTVEFGTGLTEIGKSAFQNCESLESVKLPSTLEVIGESAFAYCSKLVGPELPATLTLIDQSAFDQCSAYGPITLQAGIHVGSTAFRKAGVSAINFPSEPCTFGQKCFEGNTLIASIKFPDWMTEIPIGFCKDWTKLDKVTMSDAVTIIRAEAFSSCTSLHDVTFPSALQMIGMKAFYNCKSEDPKFGEVTLYEGVLVADNAFEQATVTSIVFKGCAIFDDDCFKNVKDITEITFPACMDTIPSGFCSNWTNLKKVTLPTGVKVISQNAFNYCTSLTEIDLPETIEEIGEKAFFNAGLKTLTWPSHPVKIGKEAFRSSALETLEIPAWMDTVPEGTFQYCSSLTALKWQVRSSDGASKHIVLCNNAFSHCSALETLQMPPVEAVFKENTFSNCGIKKILWTDQPLYLEGKATFADCEDLESVTIPPTLSYLPTDCFNSCGKLAKVDLGEKTFSIGTGCFRDCAITEIVWSPEISLLMDDCFFNNPMTTLEIPATIGALPKGCFQDCKNLIKPVLPEGLYSIGESAFRNNQALTELITPSTLTSIGAYAFYDCPALHTVKFNEGLTKIDYQAFRNATALKEVTLPSTLKNVGQDGFSHSGLEKVISYADGVTFGSSAFNGCLSLTTFTSDAYISKLSSNCFYGCTALTDFIYPEDMWVGTLEQSAFSSCSSLRAFPYLKESSIGGGVFRDCTSLREIRLSEAEGFKYTTGQLLTNTTSLESIIWPSTAQYFGFESYDIANAPLRALSYSFAQDICEIGGRENATINRYKDNITQAGYSVTTPAVSKLLVKRGEKWKYMEAGYGEVFDIIEMKEPRIRIMGDIFSQYNAETDRNHYKANMRWEVPLSDLNENGPTEVEVFRDGVKIADVVFSKPSEPKHVEGLDADQVIEVDVTVNGKPNEFTGDFDFPVVENGQTIYVMQYAKEEPKMYFDAYTSRRQVSFDKYGYTSWFTLVDEFDSPLLNTESELVPMSYTYTARMKGYDYTELVNNEGLLPGADGLLYHPEERSLQDMDSEPCVMYVGMADPSLAFTGLYSTEQVLADRDHTLAATRAHGDGNRNYQLTYALDEDLAKQRGRIEGQNGTSYIITQIQAVEVLADGTTSQFATATPNGRASGSFNIPANLSPQPGKRYQTITQSFYRGNYGSPVVTIPDAPTVTSMLLVEPHEHWDLDTHTHAAYYGRTVLIPDVTPMGYKSTMPPAGNYHLGVWRSIVETAPEAAVWLADVPMTTAATSAGTLIRHTEGRIDDPNIESHCSQCATGSSFEATDTEIHHTDVFDINHFRFYTVNYNNRLYVKVPDDMLAGDEKWMVVDASNDHSGDVLTGIEDVRLGGDEGQVRWYDLQGRPVANPTPGTTYLKVTREGACKVRHI